jgi:hypothetical protein
MSDFYLTKIGGRSEANRPLSVAAEDYRGDYKIAADSATLDAAQNDTVGLFPIRSDATLSQVTSLLAFGALGAGVTGDVGFAPRDDIAFAGVDNALASTVDMSTAGSAKLVAALGAADIGKRVYELAGLTKDPSGDFWVELTLKGVNPASGLIAFEQAFVTN